MVFCRHTESLQVYMIMSQLFWFLTYFYMMAMFMGHQVCYIGSIMILLDSDWQELHI